MNSTTKIQLTELNPHLICVLCGGYLIDATTIIECIHSFCRTCIIRYLESSKYCPICDVQVHKTKPLTNVRSDKTLQTLVYKLVPGLFKDEMRKRREFYAANQDCATELTSHSINTSELRGEIQEEDNVSTKSDEERISVCLQHCVRLPPYKNDSLISTVPANPVHDDADRRYLLCPSGVTIGHLKKLIRMKFDLPTSYRLEIFYSDESLRDGYTLLDVAHIYAWRRMEPLKLYYIVYDQTIAQLHLTPPSVKDMARLLPETPAEARKRANRKRRLESERRKVHEISDSEPSDNESKKEDETKVDSSAIILTVADGEGQDNIGPSMLSEKDKIEKSVCYVPDSVSDPAKGKMNQSNESKNKAEETEQSNEAEKKVDKVSETDDALKQMETTSERGKSNEPTSSVTVATTTSTTSSESDSSDVVVVEGVSEESPLLEVTPQSADNDVDQREKHTSDISTPNDAAAATSNGIESASSEKAKTPKSKSINDIVSKIKAKSNPSEQVVILDILPGVVPMDISESDGNENKQPTSVIKKTTVNSVAKALIDSAKSSKVVINNNHPPLVVPCDSTSAKPKPKKVSAKSKNSKHSTYLQDSHVVNTTVESGNKTKKGRKTKLDKNDKSSNEPASKKCKVDSTVDLSSCELLTTKTKDNDIEVVAFELSRDSTNEHVVVLS